MGTSDLKGRGWGLACLELSALKDGDLSALGT